MNIMLGNLSVSEIEGRAGVKFPDELITYMKDRHQSNASNVASGKWHCFDLPFNLVCGSKDVAEEIVKYLSPLADKFEEPLQISVYES